MARFAGWTEVRGVCRVVGEGEVQVALAEVEWEEVLECEEAAMGRWGGGRAGPRVRARKGGRG